MSNNGGKSSRYQWTIHLREYLAKCVGEREKLWKKFPVVSHDLELRAALWNEVAQAIWNKFQVQVDVDDMKKTWKNLKDNYLRMRRIYETEPDRALKWHFFNTLRFMDRAGIDESLFGQKMRAFYGSDDSKKSILPNGSYREFEINNGVNLIQKKALKRQRDHLEEGSVEDQLLTQIGFTDIDKLIVTKQLPPSLLLRYHCSEQDIGEAMDLFDILEEICAGEKNIFLGYDDDSSTNSPSAFDQSMISGDESMLDTEQNSEISYEMTNEESRSTSPMIIDEIRTALEYRPINGGKPDHERQMMIINAVRKMRHKFHALSLKSFIDMSMPEGHLNSVMSAYDAYIYHNETRSELIDKVLATADDETSQLFELLFITISFYRGVIRFKGSSGRWAQIDAESKKNYTEMMKAQKKSICKKALYKIRHLEFQLRTLIEKISQIEGLIESCNRSIEDEEDPSKITKLEEKLKLAEKVLIKRKEERDGLRKNIEETRSELTDDQKRLDAEWKLNEKSSDLLHTDSYSNESMEAIEDRRRTHTDAPNLFKREML